MKLIIIGHGLIIEHFRENEQCGVLEAMEPIDENRKYDFNYQQFTYLDKEVQVFPVKRKLIVSNKVYIYTMINFL